MPNKEITWRVWIGCFVIRSAVSKILIKAGNAFVFYARPTNRTRRWSRYCAVIQKIGRAIVTENVWNELSTGGSHKWFLTYFRMYLITLEPGAERMPQADGGDDTVCCHASQRSLQAAAQICFPPVWFIGCFLLQFVSGAILLSCLFLHLVHLRYDQDAASFLEKLATTERFTISFKKNQSYDSRFQEIQLTWGSSNVLVCNFEFEGNI